MITDSERRLAARLLDRCETRYQELQERGVDPDVARDRIYDALQFAYGEVGQVADKHDAAFAYELKEMTEGN